MTALTERPTYVGARRFANVPEPARAARHRASEPLVVALLAQFLELVTPIARALVNILGGRWAARTTARAAVVVVVSSMLLAAMLIGSALVMVEPLRSEPRPAIVTPSPTPYPSGWTYEP